MGGGTVTESRVLDRMREARFRFCWTAWDLAHDLRLSRQTVRKALVLLASRGLVDRTPSNVVSQDHQWSITKKGIAHDQRRPPIQGNLTMTDTKTVPCEPVLTVPSSLLNSLLDLVPLHDKFMRAQGGYSGNQEDAYNLVATRWDEWAKARSAAEKISLLMLAAAPAHQPDRQGAGEPVAWRVRRLTDDPEEWQLRPAGAALDFGNRKRWEIQPLYAAPPPPADTAMREAIARIIGERVSGPNFRNDPDMAAAQEADRLSAADAILATLSRGDAAEGRG